MSFALSLRRGARSNYVRVALVAAALSIFTAAALGEECAPTRAGAVGSWGGDGNAQDSIGGNHGTTVGDVTFGSGIVNGAFTFNGSGSGVQIPHSPSYDIRQSLTLEAWVMRTGPCTNNCIIVMKQNGNVCCSDFRYGLLVYGLNGVVPGHALLAFNTGSWTDVVASTAPLEWNRWYHVVGTYDGIAARLYIDGTLDREVFWSGSILQSDRGLLYLGQDVFEFGGEHFEGKVDEVTIYDRVLSPSEVATNHAAATCGGDPVPPVINLTSPIDGGKYAIRSEVPVMYSCSDSGSGVATCGGSAPSGSLLNTSRLGTYSFSVSTTDNAGNETSMTVTYSVVAGKKKPR